MTGTFFLPLPSRTVRITSYVKNFLPFFFPHLEKIMEKEGPPHSLSPFSLRGFFFFDDLLFMHGVFR